MKTNYWSPEKKEYIKISLLAIIMLIIPTILIIVGNSESIEQDKVEYSSSASSSNRGISDTKYQEEDKSSTQWKRFAGDSYRASKLVNNIWQNFAFNFNNSGRGKYIMFGTLPGSNVVTDQMELEISRVSSDANFLYLHCDELNSPVKIKIVGNSLYTYDGSERYEKWQ